jgi:hypothetical protein
MNTNWAKILLFSLLSFVLGFILSCLVCGPCMGGRGGCDKDMGGCHRRMSCCDADGNCEHGGSCCKAGGQCDKAGCDHAALMEGHGGAACMRGHGGKGACCAKGDGMHGEGKGHHEPRVRAIVKDLENANFQGDTTIAIPGGTVNVVMEGDHTELRVNVQDSLRKEVRMEHKP